MKGLQFLGNRVEDAANAFIDVLKYSEVETIGHYKKIQKAIGQYKERPDYDDVNYFLEKLIADEEHHIKLLKEALGVDKSTKGVTVIIK